MIHENDKEHTGGRMFIANIETNFVNTVIAPAVEDEEIYLKYRGLRKRAVGWIVAERILYIGDGIVDKVIEPSLRLIR